LQSKNKADSKAFNKRSKTKQEALFLTIFRSTDKKKSRKGCKLFRKYKKTKDLMEPDLFLIRSRKLS